MATSRDEILHKALSLPEQDRADLIGALIESLDAGVEEGVEEAWRVEIERRAKELDSGAVQSIPWEVVKAHLSRARVASSHTVRLHPLAADEAEGARTWYLVRNPTVADAFLLELDAAIALRRRSNNR